LAAFCALVLSDRGVSLIVTFNILFMVYCWVKTVFFFDVYMYDG